MLPEPFQTYVRLGFRIFPAQGKHPMFSGWQAKATSETKQIAAWLRQYPQANWGLATGNGLVVIDVDPRHGGMASLQELKSKYGDALKTVISHTGGGGWHLIFRTSDKVRNAVNLLPGIDIRGDGGLIILPPSIHPDTGRRYEWVKDYAPDERDFVPLPEGLAVQLRAPAIVKYSSGETASQWSKLPADVALRLPQVCPWLKDAVDAGANRVNYSQWVAMASWAHSMTDEPQLFFNWSKPYYEFDEREARAKWHQTATLSPVGCASINGQACQTCPHRAANSNPVMVLRKQYAAERGESGAFGAPEEAEEIRQLLSNLANTGNNLRF